MQCGSTSACPLSLRHVEELLAERGIRTDTRPCAAGSPSSIPGSLFRIRAASQPLVIGMERSVSITPDAPLCVGVMPFRTSSANGVRCRGRAGVEYGVVSRCLAPTCAGVEITETATGSHRSSPAPPGSKSPRCDRSPGAHPAGGPAKCGARSSPLGEAGLEVTGECGPELQRCG